MTATSSFILRVYKLRVSPRISHAEVPFKDSTLSTFRAYSGTLLTNVWIQFKSGPNADICACFYPVFSQAKLHWLSKAFCLSKNIGFDLSIAQWQLITAQNRDFLFFFFFFNTIKNLLFYRMFSATEALFSQNQQKWSAFFQSGFNISSRASTEFKSY